MIWDARLLTTARDLHSLPRVCDNVAGSWRAAGRSHELLAGGDAGAVPGTEQDVVLATGGRGEVWQRQLAGAAWALLLFNNGMAASAPVECRCGLGTREG